VASAVSCIVIKSDFFPRRIPVPGEMVRVAGQTGSFVVMQVDRRRRIVQLMEKSGRHRLVDVPFRSVRIFNRNLAQAIHRFLDACDEVKSQNV
jgi:DNA integrity scanning protein DisA with diadenylate cyclase activity